ncbi:MAG: hypothetical protein HKM05_11910 [Spirochaetales bacterium]|nr:hypothetical protein [Spirochaetales bacterium]
MLLSLPDDPLFLALDQFLSVEKARLLEVASRTKNGTTKVSLTIYSPEGLTLEGLAHLHKLLLPKLEELLSTEDLYVEVGTPGLERNLKYNFELELFLDRPIQILREGDSEWLSGVLSEANDASITLETEKGSVLIDKKEIRKARLNDL